MTKHFSNLTQDLPADSEPQGLLVMLAQLLTAEHGAHAKLTWAIEYKDEWTHGQWVRSTGCQYESLDEARESAETDMIHADAEGEGQEHRIVPVITLEGEIIPVPFMKPDPALAAKQREAWAA